MLIIIIIIIIIIIMLIIIIIIIREVTCLWCIYVIETSRHQNQRN